MKRLFIAAIGLTAIVSSCKKNNADADYQKPLVPGATVDTLIGDITVNTTVTKTTYLKGIVYVRPGVTLTVNPGVTIKGSPGVIDLVNLENNKGTLVVEKGGKLVANGTASSPIIWTSASAAGSRNFGDWGGIVLLGQAPIKAATGTIGAASNTFEAFTALPNAPRNDYGGANAADNSGSITYNRIEFAGGIVAAPNREVNGLTLCGVGNGTTIHHVEVSNSGDDAFEFFGGTVNVHHLLAFGNKDDDFDFDEKYVGNLQFIISFRNDLADNSGSEMIELDSYTSTATTDFSKPFIANATLIGPTSTTVRPGVVGTFDGGIYVRDAGRIILVNSLIIAQAFPTAFGSTPSTNPALLNSGSGAANASEVRSNIFQTSAAIPVALDGNEANPILGALDNALIGVLGNATNKNTALATFADFKLGALLNPLAGSPALSGGINLAAAGVPGFVGTTARGAVIPGDIWTSGAWISIATN